MRILLSLLPASLAPLKAQTSATNGWYNGDRKPGIPAVANWHLSATGFARAYDDFLVPFGGWTVTGVLSNDTLINGAPPVTYASWEIRSGMSAGQPGTLVASGVSAATQTPGPGDAYYCIRVDGLQVWVSTGYPADVATRAPASATPVVTVGEQQANVSFAGLAPGGVGICEIDIVLPSGLPVASVPISIASGGITSNIVPLPAAQH